jgi:hypothetical protein
MQAYGDQLLTHALTNQQQPPHLEISSLSVSLPPLSPPVSATSPPQSPILSLKRKRDNDEPDTKSVKVSLDQARITKSKLLRNKLYTSYHNHHLDTILSSYTHDC